MKRAIWIDARNWKVEEMQIEEATELQQMQSAVEGYIERGLTLTNGDDVYVNEEGLLKGWTHGFQLDEAPPFTGNAIILGAADREGETTPAKSTVEQIQGVIRWAL